MNRLEAWIDAWVAFVARSWLALFATALGVFVALPIAAPVLAASGHARLAGWIYFVYRVTCHQLPHHSWFLFGRAPAYDWETVQPFTGVAVDQPLLAFHHVVGDPTLGYQLAFCQRDLAIWSAMFVATVAFGVVARGRAIRPLPLRWYAVALIPIAVDGISQLVGLRESTPFMRSVTGALFGAATAALVVPHLDLAFRAAGVLSERARARRSGPEPSP